VVSALQNHLPAGAVLYRWAPDRPEDNPYLALLGLADRFIVTGDSISMMVEVARRGRPLAIFELPYQNGPATWIRRLLARIGASEKGGPGPGTLSSRFLALLQSAGVTGYPRDLATIHSLLYRQKLAVPLGTPFPNGGTKAVDELSRVVQRIRRIILADRT
jgi:hypothetical protein